MGVEISKLAREAALVLQCVDTSEKNTAILSLADALEKHREEIQRVNAIDVERAKKNELSNAFIDRLTLSDNVMDEMIAATRSIAELDDPVGRVLEERTLKNNLLLRKVSTPLGVVLVVFESRPNLVIDTATLCLKSGNAIILKGGSDAMETNKLLNQIFVDVMKKQELPEHTAQLLVSREAVTELLTDEDCTQYIDVVIPRGGEGLVRSVTEHSRIPVLKHEKGVCNMYVDKDADMDVALSVCVNAKCQRPGVCNAIENLLVHESIAKDFLPRIVAAYQDEGVRLMGCEKTVSIVDIEKADEREWDVEYDDLVLSIKIVESVEGAVDFINEHGSGHSDAIISTNEKAISSFMGQVDSSAVFSNASTRFNDGFMFEMGAEIGISTGKIHARGPMALQELTSYKYLVFGEGQIRG